MFSSKSSSSCDPCPSYNDCNNVDIKNNPDPLKWILTGSYQGKGGYVLDVRYLDCTNFEGRKLLVFKGKYDRVAFILRKELDPHFLEDNKLMMARFRPTKEGYNLAKAICEIL